jgi:hypothetical protein
MFPLHLVSVKSYAQIISLFNIVFYGIPWSPILSTGSFHLKISGKLGLPTLWLPSFSQQFRAFDGTQYLKAIISCSCHIPKCPLKNREFLEGKVWLEVDCLILNYHIIFSAFFVFGDFLGTSEVYLFVCLLFSTFPQVFIMIIGK